MMKPALTICSRTEPVVWARDAVAAPVTVAAATAQDVPIYLDGLGTVQASNTIAIRTQTNGTLQSVNFVEGQQKKTSQQGNGTMSRGVQLLS